ncbi:hypothetical protein [Nocardia tengchongensis]|uniref:hypothetical protein n=1 Tax=Nocardia tengchongensis TaxID=2055889 RepID=UPI003657EF27
MTIRNAINTAATDSGWAVVEYHATGIEPTDFSATSTYRRGDARITIEWSTEHEPIGAFFTKRPGTGDYVPAAWLGTDVCAHTVIAMLCAPARDPQPVTS